jgi:hypothetical protein
VEGGPVKALAGLALVAQQIGEHPPSLRAGIADRGLLGLQAVASGHLVTGRHPGVAEQLDSWIHRFNPRPFRGRRNRKGWVA